MGKLKLPKSMNRRKHSVDAHTAQTGKGVQLLELDITKMANQGASLQNYNNELVKCVEDLREKREEINRQILKEEEEKAKIQRDLSILTDRLSTINETLQRKIQARNEYDRTIQETEAAYMKILESSQTLLQVLKRETVNLVKKKQSSH